MNLQQRMYAARIQNLAEAKDSPEQKAYKELFDKMLEKYGVDSPNDIPKEKKDDFFNEIEAAWKKDPANDSEGVDEMSSLPIGAPGFRGPPVKPVTPVTPDPEPKPKKKKGLPGLRDYRPTRQYPGLPTNDNNDPDSRKPRRDRDPRRKTSEGVSEATDGGGPGGGGKGGHGTPPPSVSDAAGMGPLTMNGMLTAFGSDDLRYDFNGDGIVDGADFGLFLARFGG